MESIKIKTVLNQLKKDLIGKDSYRGVTLSYAWLANQFGHIALGFIPTFILHTSIKDIDGYENSICASLMVLSFWFLFELYNFLGPLLNKNKKYMFKPKWLNIAYDTFTDVVFFGLGAFLYTLYVNGITDRTALTVVILISIYLIKASSYWYLTKIYQYYANYPFQFRLSQWDFNIRDEEKETILNYMESNSSGNHLLVFGSHHSGKTSLGVGVLNELSIKHKVCLYTSAMKLFSFFLTKEKTKSNNHTIWSWKESEYLLVDDVNPGNPIEEELVSPKKIAQFLDSKNTKNIDEETSKLIASKNIIWVLGGQSSIAKENQWLEVLLKIGVDKNKIRKINLTT